jgi:glucose dehydrogenase
VIFAVASAIAAFRIAGAFDVELFRAFNSRTGEELWRFQTGFGADAPAATYEIDAQQYVAIAAGGSRDGLKEAKGDLVWSFKLGGKLNPLNGPPAPRTVITVESAPNGRAE